MTRPPRSRTRTHTACAAVGGPRSARIWNYLQTAARPFDSQRERKTEKTRWNHPAAPSCSYLRYACFHCRITRPFRSYRYRPRRRRSRSRFPRRGLVYTYGYDGPSRRRVGKHDAQTFRTIGFRRRRPDSCEHDTHDIDQKQTIRRRVRSDDVVIVICD